MAKYEGDPIKYASALANSYTYQTKCPVMGEDIDPKSFATLANGTKIYFCCKGCDKKLFADPAKYAPKLAAQGITFDPKGLTATPTKAEPAHDHKEHDHD
jgi:YHS domain-containing protein